MKHGNRNEQDEGQQEDAAQGPRRDAESGRGETEIPEFKHEMPALPGKQKRAYQRDGVGEEQTGSLRGSGKMVEQNVHANMGICIGAIKKRDW